MNLVTYKINYDIKSSNLMQLCNVQMTCMKFDLEIRKYEKSTRLKTNDTKKSKLKLKELLVLLIAFHDLTSLSQ